MNSERLRAFVRENWPALTIGGDWDDLLNCGTEEVAFLQWTDHGQLIGIRTTGTPAGEWIKGKAAMKAAIDRALDTLIARHASSIVRLVAAKEGKQ